MTDQKYNGWSNWQTWAVMLWIDNDEGSQSYWLDCAMDSDRAAPRNHFSTNRRQEQRMWLADLLKSEYQDRASELIESEASVFTYLMSAALDAVDWHEIAESLLNDTNELSQ